jgi:hypothetical protein
MKKLKVLHVIFENRVEAQHVAAFRAAVAGKIKTNKILFHHHLDENKRLFRYPLAQFKIVDNKAHVLCMEDACEPMMEFLAHDNGDVQIAGNSMSLSVLNLNLKQINIQVWDKALSYRIDNWLALNPDNYKKYFTIASLAERIVFLEKILTAHIIAFAEGIRFDIQKPLKVTIHDIYKERWIEYRKVKLLAFDLKFSVNMTLPSYVGLGKAVSVGHGIVKRLKIANHIEQQYFASQNKTN